VVVVGPEDDGAALVDALDGARAPGSVSRVDHHREAVQGMSGFTTA
jgi:hypothetical protein